jgi:hypothetical protein
METQARHCADEGRLEYPAVGVESSFYRPLATGRQSELKSYASVLVRDRPEPSAVRLDNRAADCQSHSLRIRLVEWRKHAINVFWAQART